LCSTFFATGGECIVAVDEEEDIDLTVLGDEREAESGSAVTRRLRVLKWEKGK
jgi:hypothetical protein